MKGWLETQKNEEWKCRIPFFIDGRLSARAFNHGTNMLVEFIALFQLLDAEVHAPAPIVAWVGWDVDSLGTGIRVAQLLVDGEPILP